MGADPFIVSAMGSHGGGSEEGQRKFWMVMALQKKI